MLTGKLEQMLCNSSEPFGVVKARLATRCGLPAGRLNLICRGEIVSDADTPVTLEAENETLIHVVRKNVSDLGPPSSTGSQTHSCGGLMLPQVDLSEVYSEAVLFANCKYCEAPISPFDIRPLCHRCG
jgi:hypothetical protein